MAKEAVLQQLQQAADCLSGEEMAQSLGISRAAVWTAREALRREG